MSLTDPPESDAALGRGSRRASRHVLQRGVRAAPDLRVPDSSVRSVGRVAKTDGRTTVQAYRTAGGEWCLPRRRTRFTTESIAQMRRAGVAEVILRRRLERAALPLSWIL
jgi:hypothetical protein